MGLRTIFYIVLGGLICRGRLGESYGTAGSYGGASILTRAPSVRRSRATEEAVIISPMTTKEKLQEVIRRRYGCESIHVQTQPVFYEPHDSSAGMVEVEVFDLVNYPRAKRCYGWHHITLDVNEGIRYIAVLEIPPVISATAAVKEAMAEEFPLEPTPRQIHIQTLRALTLEREALALELEPLLARQKELKRFFVDYEQATDLFDRFKCVERLEKGEYKSESSPAIIAWVVIVGLTAVALWIVFS